MKVTVQLFARARDLAGTGRVELDVPAPGCVSDLKQSLASRFPQVSPLLPNLPGMAEAGLDTASRKLLGLQSMYGDDHPDVRRAKREFEEAKARRDDEVKRFRQERQQEAVGRIDAEIREHEANLADLEKELASFQKRVDAAPRWGAELAGLTREYEVLNKALALRRLRMNIACQLRRPVEAATFPGGARHDPVILYSPVAAVRALAAMAWYGEYVAAHAGPPARRHASKGTQA